MNSNSELLEIEQFLKYVGGIRDPKRFQENHEILAGPEFYYAMHISFLEEVQFYCKKNNIDLVFASAPCNCYVPLDKTRRITYCPRTFTFKIDTNLPFENIGRLAAYELFDFIELKKRNDLNFPDRNIANVVSLYLLYIENKNIIKLRFDNFANSETGM